MNELSAGQSDQHQPPRTALVTGAMGVLGPTLVQQLVDAGFQVRTFDRTPLDPGLFPKGVTSICADICDKSAITSGLQGVHIVFHLAALLHIPNPSPSLRDEYWKVNVEGTRALVEASLASRVSRFVFFSTINVYGASGDVNANESTAPRPNNLYSETKLAAEEIVLSSKTEGNTRPMGVVLRMAPIYGPRMKGNYPKLVEALSRGLFVPVGDGSNRRPLVLDEDAVRAAILAATSERAAGQIYNVSDGQAYHLRDIIAAICGALGCRPPRFYLPTGPTLLAARIVDSVAGLTGRSFNLVGSIGKLTENVVVDSSKIQNELGFRAQFGLEEGWRRALTGWAP